MVFHVELKGLMGGVCRVCVGWRQSEHKQTKQEIKEEEAQEHQKREMQDGSTAAGKCKHNEQHMYIIMLFVSVVGKKLLHRDIFITIFGLRAYEWKVGNKASHCA